MEAPAATRTGAPPLAAPAAGSVLAVAGWALVVLAGHLWGQHLVDRDFLVHIGAPPLVGTVDVVLDWRALPAVALAAAGVAWGPALAGRLRWRLLLPATWLASVAWMLALAVSRGGEAIGAPLASRYEYLAALPLVRGRSLTGVLSSFTDVLATYPTHVKGHPPGFLLVVWAMDALGLRGPTAAALLVVAVGAVAAPAAVVAARPLLGEAVARSAAPFLVLLPAAVWMATSADAFFTGVAAAGIALFAVAVHRDGARGALLAAAAGLVLGAGLLSSYGIAPLGLVVLALAVHTRRWTALAWGAAGVAVVLGGAAALGFWWPDGLDATRTLYVDGIASRRPYAPFLVIALAAFACATGPAPWAGLARLRTRAAWLLPGAALAAVLVADLSGLSKGENERIWLPFVPWIALAAAGMGRAWLASGAVLALALQLTIASPW